MKRFFVILTAISAVALSMVSCGQGSCCQECDSLQLVMEDLMRSDSLKSQMLEDYDSHISQFGNVQDSIAMYQRSVDSLKSVIRAKGSATGDDRQLLQRFMKEIRGLISKNEELARELKDAGYQNASMDKLIKMMFQSIEDKQRQLKQTQQEIAELKVQVQGLQTRVEELSSENATMTTTIESLNTKVSQISGTIKVVQPKERKAKKIQQLTLVYTLKANPDAPKGRVNVYVRIMDSNGSILKNPEGEFMFQGQSIAYTLRHAADYNGESCSGTMVWNKTTQNLEPGSYTVDFYIEGRRDCQDTFVLDK